MPSTAAPRPLRATPRPLRATRSGTLRALAVALVVGSALTGCGTTSSAPSSPTKSTTQPSGQGSTVNSPEQELKERPSADAAGADYRTLLARLRDRLAELVPTAQWSTSEPAVESAAPCRAPFDTVAAAISETWRGVTGVGSIPDAQWPAVLKELTAIAEEFGFATVTTIKDQPGEHAVTLHGRYAEELEIATEKNTTVTLFGGCFLDATPATVPVVPPSAGATS